MKKIQLLAFAATVLIGTACSKQKDIPAPVPAPLSEKKLAAINFTYDNNGDNYIRVNYTAGGKIGSYETKVDQSAFDYSQPGKIMVVSVLKINGLSYENYVCELDVRGFITKMITKNNNGVVTGTRTMSYDAEGYMIANHFQSSTIDEEVLYEYSSGNLVKSRRVRVGYDDEVTVYTTDTNVENKAKLTIHYYWLGGGLYGKPYKNMIKDAKTYDINGNLIWQYSVDTQKDAAGYPVTSTISYPNGQFETRNFIYQ